MSTDWGRPNRRRAGSDCSRTSPRVGRKSECLGLGGWAGGSGPRQAASWLQQAGKRMQPQVSSSPCPPGQDPSLSRVDPASSPFPQAWTQLSSEHLLLSTFWKFLEQAFTPFPFKGFSADLRLEFMFPEL